MNLKKFREIIKISQYELADKLEMSRSTLSNYEKGNCEPSIATLIKLADFFNITIDELVERPTDIINLNYLDNTRRELIKDIKEASDSQVALINAYWQGMKLAEEERQAIINRTKNGGK